MTLPKTLRGHCEYLARDLLGISDASQSIDCFTGADGQTYVWHLNGSVKVLSQENRSGPIVAKHVDHRPDGGTLELTPEAYDVGDMLFISFLTQEGYRGRTRRPWLKGFSGPWGFWSGVF